MRIISIISNELIVNKQKLELELERVLNDKDIDTEERVTKTLNIINKLSEANSSFATWQAYTAQENQKEN